MDIKCSVVQDLLPSYIDGLCNHETNSIVESHLCNCEKCTELLNLTREKIFHNNNSNTHLHAKEPFVKVKRHYRKKVVIFSFLVFFITTITAGIIYLHFAPVDFDARACGGGFRTWIFDKHKDTLIARFITEFDNSLELDDVSILDGTESVAWNNRNISISFDIAVKDEQYRICIPGKRIWIETYKWGNFIFVTDDYQQELKRSYLARVKSERDEYIYLGLYGEKYNPVIENDSQYFNELKNKHGIDLNEPNTNIDLTDDELERVNPNFYYSEKIKTAGAKCQEKYKDLDLLSYENKELLLTNMNQDLKKINFPDNLFVDAEAIYMRGIVIQQLQEAYNKDNSRNMQNDMPYSYALPY
jgi:hypothetical protein